jgi:hypothetical protein
MGVGAYNICIYQGQTYSKTFIWSAGTCCGAGTVGATPIPVDLTGYTANLQIRPFAGSTTLLYDASTNIVLGGVTGTIVLTIPSIVTETFTWPNGVYDLFLTDSSGNVTPLLAGMVTVTPAVSLV